MTGRATATMDPSSGAMKAPMDVRASSSQRRSLSCSRVIREIGRIVRV